MDLLDNELLLDNPFPYLEDNGFSKIGIIKQSASVGATTVKSAILELHPTKEVIEIDGYSDVDLIILVYFEKMTAEKMASELVKLYKRPIVLFKGKSLF